MLDRRPGTYPRVMSQRPILTAFAPIFPRCCDSASDVGMLLALKGTAGQGLVRKFPGRRQANRDRKCRWIRRRFWRAAAGSRCWCASPVERVRISKFRTKLMSPNPQDSFEDESTERHVPNACVRASISVVDRGRPQHHARPDQARRRPASSSPPALWAVKNRPAKIKVKLMLES